MLTLPTGVLQRRARMMPGDNAIDLFPLLSGRIIMASAEAIGAHHAECLVP